MQEMKPRIQALPFAFAVLAGSVLAGCGDTGLPVVGPDDVAGRTAHSILVDQTFADVPADGERTVEFSLPRAGTLTLRVGWTDESNAVVAVLTGAACPDLRREDESCRPRGTSERPPGKEGRESLLSYPQTSGSYRLWLKNQGPGPESISVTVELTYRIPAPAASPDSARPDRRDPRERERAPRPI